RGAEIRLPAGELGARCLGELVAAGIGAFEPAEVAALAAAVAGDEERHGAAAFLRLALRLVLRVQGRRDDGRGQECRHDCRELHNTSSWLDGGAEVCRNRPST